ncbi:hypothetical protein G6F56_006926 [Rhizopus delemar]|nr:hypothetical protein G6F56_006926 [Rhizopus delemar]
MKFVSLALGAIALLTLSQVEAQKKPNIVFIFTDDQDYQLNSLDFMPNVQKHLVEKGTLFKNHYATISLCCPSRVSLLRGQYAHNTNITDVSPPYGGYGRFNTLKLGEDYLPLWLQKAGYNTNYIGKLMNQYSVNNYNNPTPKGFDYQDQLVDPYTYVYNTAVFSKNGQAPVYYKDAYQTDIIHAKAKAALKRLENSTDPFFLWVSPMAPHAQFTIYGNGSMTTSPAVPAARHAHLFKDVKIPRHANFNPTQQTKTASYWKNLERLNETMVENFDEAYRDRLRALQAVDEMVGSLFEELERQGELDNTYVFYSADNGYHLGQHRSYPGKTSNIEEDINVPFVVRGPGVAQGKVSELVSTHHDLPSTFLALANAEAPSWVDGGVIPIIERLKNHRRLASKESFAVEFWTDTNLEEIYKSADGHVKGPNIYKTVRVIAPGYNYGTVKSLEDALDSQYDTLYTQFRPMAFEECLPYYNVNNESPQIGYHFLSNLTASTTVTAVAAKKPAKQAVLQKREKIEHQLPQEYHKLFKSVPVSSHAGHELPQENFEEHAIPVSEKLLKTPVNWSEYNFYSFGN